MENTSPRSNNKDPLCQLASLPSVFCCAARTSNSRCGIWGQAPPNGDGWLVFLVMFPILIAICLQSAPLFSQSFITIAPIPPPEKGEVVTLLILFFSRLWVLGSLAHHLAQAVDTCSPGFLTSPLNRFALCRSCL